MSILSTEFPIFGALTNDVQPSNALLIPITLSGMAGALTNDVQPLNMFAIPLTLSGMVGAVTKDVQSLNTLFILRTGLSFIVAGTQPTISPSIISPV